MNKPMRFKVMTDATTVERGEKASSGGFKSSVPAGAIRPKPVVIPTKKKSSE